MSYLARLSSRQRLWLVGTLVVTVAIVTTGWILEPKGDAVDVPSFSTNMTIRQIAPKIGTTGFAMAKEIGLPRSVDKDTPLVELGVEQDKLDEVAAQQFDPDPPQFAHGIGRGVRVCFAIFGSRRIEVPDEDERSLAIVDETRDDAFARQAGERSRAPDGQEDPPAGGLVIPDRFILGDGAELRTGLRRLVLRLPLG